MRYTSSIRQLQNDSRYTAASRLLESLMRSEEPEYALLTELYGLQQAPILHRVFARFLEQHAADFGLPREHQPHASYEISEARSHVEESADFQNLQSLILFGELPTVDALEVLYGKYAGEVREILRMFLEHKLVRKCGITSAAHLNRVGAVVAKIGMDRPGEQMYAAIGFMHDALEDLLDVVRDDHRNVYTVNDYQAFLTRFSSPELHTHIKLITNFYDLILSEIRDTLRSEDRYPGKENLLRAMEHMYTHDRLEIHPYLEKMHYAIEDAELGDDAYGAAKWICYSELYIREMAIYTHSRGDYRTFEIKAIDLSDNGHGRDALSLGSRIKNLIKQQIYATYGSQLNSTWHGVNSRVAELQEDALVHAKHIIIRDFLQQQSFLDFAVSTLLKMISLKPILFVKPPRRPAVH
ncbi:MAG: hypothetical protein RRA94_05260 [Bacteroidota bacterium]|nr:hypothetical protein [Bacteroidota bacterium]